MGEHRGKGRLRMGGLRATMALPPGDVYLVDRLDVSQRLNRFRRERPWRAWPGCQVRANKRRAPMQLLLAKRALREALA